MANGLEWNVFVSDFNKKQINKYNVFNHFTFLEYCKKNAKKNAKDFDKFCDQLRKDLMYCYWSKCEWEVVITDWPTSGTCEAKIDVFDQVMLNWDNFRNYVWEHAVDLRRREKKT